MPRTNEGIYGASSDTTIPPPARPFTSSSHFVCHKVTLFMSPVILVLGLLLFNVMYLRSSLAAAEAASYRISAIEHSAVHATAIVRNSLLVVTEEGGSPV